MYEVGLDPYVNALAEFIRNPDPTRAAPGEAKARDIAGSGNGRPMTISIEGGWGAGKSTFAEKLGERLRCGKDPMPVVEFKPWLHDKHEDLWKALVRVFHRDMRDHLPRRKYFWRMLVFRYRRWFMWGRDKERTRWARLVLATVVSGFLLVLGLLSLWVWVAEPLWVRAMWLREAGDVVRSINLWLEKPLGMGLAVLAVVAAVAKLLPQFAARMQQSHMDSTAPLVHRLEHGFCGLVGALCPMTDDPCDRAVLIVDDLDRCTAMGVSETLRALSALLNDKVNVTVVLAIDRERIAAALASEGETISRFQHAHANHDDESGEPSARDMLRMGHRFLEKFIHVTMRVPAFDDKSSTLLIRAAMGRLEPGECDAGACRIQSGKARREVRDALRVIERLAPAMTDAFSNNPRRLLHWRNETHLRLLTMSALGRLSGEFRAPRGMVTPEQVARFEALLIARPRLLSDLRRQPLLLNWLAVWANAGAGEYPPHWELGISSLTDGMIGSLAFRGVVRELECDHHARKILESGEGASGMAPALASLDARLLLMMQTVREGWEAPWTPDVSDHERESKPIADASEEDDSPAGEDAPMFSSDSAILGGDDAAEDEAAPEPAAPEDVDGVNALDREEAPDELEPESAVVEGQMADEEQSQELFYGRDLKQAEKAVEEALARFGDQSTEYADALNVWQHFLWLHGRYQEAKEKNEEAFLIRRKALGDDHPDVAASLNNLGAVLHDQGDLSRARAHYEESLSIRRKALGDDHPDVAASLNNLGDVLHDQGDLSRARTHHEESLSIRRKAFGDDHPAVATSLSNLGGVLHDQGDLSGARSRYEEALSIRRKTLGVKHIHCLTTSARLALIDADEGKREQARQVLAGLVGKMMDQRPPVSQYPVMYGRHLRRLGGDPVAICRDKFGDEAAEAYQKKLDGPHYPDGPNSTGAAAG